MKITEKKAALAALYKELAAGQKEMEAGPLTQSRGEELEAKAKEAEALQNEVESYERVSGLAAKGREVTDVAIPASVESKGASAESEVVGYISLGSAFANSPEFKSYLAGGMPQGGSMPFGVKGLREQFLPITRKEMESKAIATIGADVIAPQRIADIARGTEMIRLTIRDLLPNERTNSSAVEYITHTPAATPAAAPTAEGALKPETTTTLGTATAPVRTIAVHMPVTEQQLQDVPQIEGLIDNELRYELAFVEERQMVWGDGTGQNLLGIFNTPNVLAGRTVTGDTLLDRIRRAITDVAVANLSATGVALHPYDSETLDLLKGSDSMYVWAVVTDDNGNQRVWGLRKVESVAMQKPTLATATNTVYERRVLVGDFVRGASLWDRQQANVAVGYVNDQFIRNMRTLRGEERLAFGVKRPRAFRYVVAQAEAA